MPAIVRLGTDIPDPIRATRHGDDAADHLVTTTHNRR